MIPLKHFRWSLEILTSYQALIITHLIVSSLKDKFFKKKSPKSSNFIDHNIFFITPLTKAYPTPSIS
jgi:phosphatidylinositol kinase/protein kinase (PI-3  family)